MNAILMNARFLPLIASVLLCAVLPAVAQAKVSGRYIVKYDAPVVPQRFNDIEKVNRGMGPQRSASAQVSTIRRLAGGEQLVNIQETDAAKLEAYVALLSKQPDVRYVEPDHRMVPFYDVNDPRFIEQWYLETSYGINAVSAWDVTRGAGVVVAVIDTGILDHPDLKANVLPGYDFIDDLTVAADGSGRDSDPTDPGDGVKAGECGSGQPKRDIRSSWHGTHVAGTLAAVANNKQGVVGVAPEAKILPLRVLGRCGGYTSDVADAMRWAAGLPVPGVANNPNPAQVINLSLGSEEAMACSIVYQETLAELRQRNVLVVVAAGNSNRDAIDTNPANCPDTFTVGATNIQTERADYSNFGSVDLVAPGGSAGGFGILSTLDSGDFEVYGPAYGEKRGTSMAVPQVAGAAALLKSLQPDMRPERMGELLRATARSLDRCFGCGAGLLDVGKAVDVAAGVETLASVANLGLTLTGQTGKYQRNDDGEGVVRYRATIKNESAQEAESVTLMNYIPRKFKALELEPSQGSCVASYMSCNLGNIEAGDTVDVDIEVRVPAVSRLAVFDVYANVVTAETDPKSNDNFAAAKFGGAVSWGALVLMLLAISRRRV